MLRILVLVHILLLPPLLVVILLVLVVFHLRTAIGLLGRNVVIVVLVVECELLARDGNRDVAGVRRIVVANGYVDRLVHGLHGPQARP
jgi:hypothetical protein